MGTMPLRHPSLRTTRSTRAFDPATQEKVGIRDSLWGPRPLVVLAYKLLDRPVALTLQHRKRLVFEIVYGLI